MQLVQDPIGGEFHDMTIEIVLIELLQLSLTLVVLAEITFLKSNSCVNLIHCHRKVILDTLDLEVREKKTSS